ncbi:hypothetical protein RCL1_004748 [Eukaryota sp. TZLM3-RCL]
MLVLVIGDFHIPYRAADIPSRFKTLLVPDKIQHILCTGNLCTQSTFEYLRSLSSDLHVVRGDFDDHTAFPEQKIVTLGDLKVGLIHGHQVVPWGDPEALGIIIRQLNCDILVTGHTHEPLVFVAEGKLIINPGSATGSPHPLKENVVPSFALLDIRGSVVNIFFYEWKAPDDFVVKKTVWKKNEGIISN